MMTPLSPTTSNKFYDSMPRREEDGIMSGAHHIYHDDNAPVLETHSAYRSNEYSRYGIRDSVPKYTRTTALGKTKTLAGLFPREWFFLALSLVNLSTAIALTIFRMYEVIRDDPTSPDFTFALLLLVNALFCLYYVFHGVLRERVYELYAFMCAILVVLMYCVLEYFAFNPDNQNTIKLVRMIIAIILAPPNIVLAFYVSRNFGFLEFRIVGASEFLQSLYRQAAIFSCLLKFDLQAAISVVLLALRDGTKMSEVEIVSLSVGIPYSILWCILGWLSLRREWRMGSWIFALLGLVKPAYYLYKIIDEYAKEDRPEEESITTVADCLIAAGAIAVVVWFMIMVELVYVYRNFGQGLRERISMVDESTGLLAQRGLSHSSSPAPVGVVS